MTPPGIATDTADDRRGEKTVATTAQIANWKASPLPYCLTRFDKNLGRSVPAGKRRFATTTAANDAIDRSRKPFGFYFIDYAGAFEAAQ